LSKIAYGNHGIENEGQDDSNLVHALLRSKSVNFSKTTGRIRTCEFSLVDLPNASGFGCTVGGISPPCSVIRPDYRLRRLSLC